MDRPMHNRHGFTLLEILMVIVVIGILAGILMGAASYMTRLARSKRLAVTRTVLETAIYRYRAEYGDWPIGEVDSDDSETITIAGENNKIVFGALRMSSDRNPDGIQFLDETTVLTWYKGEVVPLSKVPPRKEVPLLYIDGNGKYKSTSGSMNYFTVTIDTVDETVTVGNRQ